MSQQTSNRKEVRILQTALLISGVLFLILGLAGVGSAHVPEGEGWTSGTLCEGNPKDGTGECGDGTVAGTLYLKRDGGTLYVHWDLNDEFDGTVEAQFLCEGAHGGDPNADPPEGRCKGSDKDITGPDGGSSNDEAMNTWSAAYTGTATQFGIHIAILDGESIWGGARVGQATTTTTLTPTTLPATTVAGVDAERARRRAALAATGVDRNSTYMWMAAGLLLLTIALSLKGFLRETVYERVSKIIRSSGPTR